jgi:Protein of unknown function (DUF1353)
MEQLSNITGFDAKSVLHIRQLNDRERSCLRKAGVKEERIWDTWITTQELEVGSDEVDEGFDTDLVSVPNVFSWFVPRAGRYARAAVLHDCLWRHPDKHPDRRKSDLRFRQQMQADGVSLPRRWMMWAAVRSASIVTGHPGVGWQGDIPKLILLGALAIPVLVPPAIVISASNAVFYGLELIASPFDRSAPMPKPQLKT